MVSNENLIIREELQDLSFVRDGNARPSELQPYQPSYSYIGKKLPTNPKRERNQSKSAMSGKPFESQAGSEILNTSEDMRSNSPMQMATFKKNQSGAASQKSTSGFNNYKEKDSEQEEFYSMGSPSVIASPDIAKQKSFVIAPQEKQVMKFGARKDDVSFKLPTDNSPRAETHPD